MTPDDADALPDWTNAQILKVYRNALAQGWAGTTRSINGRSVTFPGPAALLQLIRDLEASIDDEELGDFALGTFNEPL